MLDSDIIALYFGRDSRAIAYSEESYGGYCYAVAYGILSNREDAQESVNDAYLAAWNSIPPAKPESLKAYLGKLTRRISISRLRKSTAKKRGGGEAELALEELGECLPSGENLQSEIERRELTAALNEFLRERGRRERNVFVLRYWYLMPTADIAQATGINHGTVRSMLNRTRAALHRYLARQGLI